MAGPARGRGYSERANLISGGALNNNAQTPFSNQFPMGEGWFEMWLRFNFTIVIGTGAGPVTEGELQIIKNVLLRSDRGEILCNLPGRALFKMASYRNGAPLRKDAIAAASATYRVSLPIYFADMYMVRPEDTILDTKRYNSVSLNVTIGGLTDLFTAPGTATLVSTIDVEVERSFGRLPAEAEPLFHINYDFRPPVDANTNTTIDIERSSDLNLKRLFVHSGTTGVIGIPWSGANSDAVQNVVQVKDQNRFIEKDRIHEMILDKNKTDAELEVILSGVEVFDFVKDKSITSSMATADKSVLQYTWTNKGGLPALSIVTVTQEGIRTLK